MKKGSLKTIQGDVTNAVPESPDEVVLIPHCCNDIGVMGAGVARALRNKWPIVFDVYQRMYESLGDISYSIVETFPEDNRPQVVVVNMIGQHGVVGPNNLKPVKYTALTKAMFHIKDLCEMLKMGKRKPVIHTPKFGSDLAGGNWEFIKELIKEIWIDNGIDVVVYEFGK